MDKYPKGSRFLRVDLGKVIEKQALDAMLSQEDGLTIPISGMTVKASDIRVTELQMHTPYVMVVFHLAENASVEAQPKPVSQQLPLPGIKDIPKQEDVDARVRAQLKSEADRDVKTIQR